MFKRKQNVAKCPTKFQVDVQFIGSWIRLVYQHRVRLCITFIFTPLAWNQVLPLRSLLQNPALEQLAQHYTIKVQNLKVQGNYIHSPFDVIWWFISLVLINQALYYFSRFIKFREIIVLREKVIKTIVLQEWMEKIRAFFVQLQCILAILVRSHGQTKFLGKVILVLNSAYVVLT
jgi:hypothetical protein